MKRSEEVLLLFNIIIITLISVITTIIISVIYLIFGISSGLYSRIDIWEAVEFLVGAASLIILLINIYQKRKRYIRNSD